MEGMYACNVVLEGRPGKSSWKSVLENRLGSSAWPRLAQGLDEIGQERSVWGVLTGKLKLQAGQVHPDKFRRG